MPKLWHTVQLVAPSRLECACESGPGEICALAEKHTRARRPHHLIRLDKKDNWKACEGPTRQRNDMGRTFPLEAIRVLPILFTRKFPFEIRPKFLEDVRCHIDAELTAEFRYAVHHVTILAIVRH